MVWRCTMSSLNHASKYLVSLVIAFFASSGIAFAVTTVIVAPDIATLRSASNTNSTIYVDSYYTGQSTGGGTLVLNSADTTSLDNGCTIFVDNNGTGNRYYRESESPLSAWDCGVTGSSANTRGAMTAGSAALTLNNKMNFQNGENISIRGAGA